MTNEEITAKKDVHVKMKEFHWKNLVWKRYYSFFPTIYTILIWLCMNYTIWNKGNVKSIKKKNVGPPGH